MTPVRAGEALVASEKKDSSFAELEQMSEQDRLVAANSLSNYIIEIDQQKQRGFSTIEHLAHFLGAALVLDQFFLKPVLPPDLRQRATEKLWVPEKIEYMKGRFKEPGFDQLALWLQTTLALSFPERRADLGITNQVIDGWISRFNGGNDQLTYEDKPKVLVYLAQLRPDRLAQCRQMLEKIGYNQADLGEETWLIKEQLMKKYNPSTAEALAGVRLLQPERSLIDEEKQAIFEAFAKRDVMVNQVGRPLNQYAQMAILLAPRVEIGTDGRILLSRSKFIVPPQPLPDRFM